MDLNLSPLDEGQESGCTDGVGSIFHTLHSETVMVNSLTRQLQPPSTTIPSCAASQWAWAAATVQATPPIRATACSFRVAPPVRSSGGAHTDAPQNRVPQGTLSQSLGYVKNLSAHRHHVRKQSRPRGSHQLFSPRVGPLHRRRLRHCLGMLAPDTLSTTMFGVSWRRPCSFSFYSTSKLHAILVHSSAPVLLLLLLADPCKHATSSRHIPLLTP